MKPFREQWIFSHLQVEDVFGDVRLYEVGMGYARWEELGGQHARFWYAGAGFTRTGESILIPIDGLDQMSDADIVSGVRGAAQVAELAGLEKSILNRGSEIDHQELAELHLAEFRRYYEREYRLLERFASQSRIVSSYYEKLKVYWESRNPDAGFNYILTDQLGHFKIGRTKQLTSRIKQLSTLPPFSIILVAAFRVVDAVAHEKLLHDAFADRRMNGEWFSFSDEELSTRVARFLPDEGIITEADLQDIESPDGKKLLTGMHEAGYNY